MPSEGAVERKPLYRSLEVYLEAIAPIASDH